MMKIPECSAVAEGPATGGPAQTMQQLIYTGKPRSRGDMSVQTGEGSTGIPYIESSSVVQSSEVIGLGGYGL